MSLNLDPKLNHIGIGALTAKMLSDHPSGKDLSVQESPDHHGGYVLSVTDAEYARIGSFANEDVAEYVHPADGMIHRSSIEAAVRKAFA